jgi:predicted ATPase
MKSEVERHVITGAPRSGKTTVVRELGERHKTFEEPVVRVIKQRVEQLRKDQQIDIPKHSVPLEVLFPDKREFLAKSQRLFLLDYDESQAYDLSFFDRGLPDLIVLHELLDVPIPAELIDVIKDNRYSDRVFVFDLLEREVFQEHRNKRPDMFNSYEECLRIRDRIMDVYHQSGYSITLVPFDSVENRELFVIKKLSIDLPGKS